MTYAQSNEIGIATQSASEVCKGLSHWSIKCITGVGLIHLRFIRSDGWVADMFRHININFFDNEECNELVKDIRQLLDKVDRKKPLT